MKKLIFLLIIAAFTANVSAATTESDNYKPKKHKKHRKHQKRKLGVCYGLGSLPKVGR
jgi:hypothetical protein